MGEGATGETGHGFSSRHQPPRFTRLRGDRLQAQPRSPKRLRGPRPRPRGEGPGAPAPTTATQRRPGRAPHAPTTARPSRATRAPEGSRTSPPGGGRGRECGPPSSSGRGGNSNPFQQSPSVIPATPRDGRPPVWVSRLSPARPRFHSTYPWTPFSLLPPRSLNVRLPLAFPLGAALRRRETRNLGRYHRARPPGWAKRNEPVLSGSSLPKPLTQSSPKSRT